MDGWMDGLHDVELFHAHEKKKQRSVGEWENGRMGEWQDGGRGMNSTVMLIE
jgi:hypothetical protein